MHKKSDISFKFKIQNDINISDWLRQYNIIVRSAYNRMKEKTDLPLNEIINIVKNSKLNNIEKLDYSMIKNACYEAKSLSGKNNVIFGSRKIFNSIKFFKYKKNPKITIEECKQNFKDKRNNRSMMLVGCASEQGNRKAKLDIIENNSIILQFDRNNHVVVEISMNNKRKKILSELQDLCEDNKACFSIKVNNENISIIFEDKYLNNNDKSYKYIQDRILSLDLNPNYIGLSICDWHSKDKNTIVHKEIIDITNLNKVKKYYYRKNKRNYETSIINKYIIGLASQYRCELVCFESLDIQSKDHCMGVKYNRLVNNCWNRTKLLQNLIKRCNMQSIKHQEVYAYYSSFIGQMTNETEYDSIAASIELSRRANLLNHKQYKDIIYPKFDISCIPTRWKEMVQSQDIKSWNEFYYLLKKFKFRYRFLFTLNNFQGISYRLKSTKSLIMIRFV